MSQPCDRPSRLKGLDDERSWLQDVGQMSPETAFIRKKAFGCSQGKGPFPYTVNHYGGIR
jgi:hypothetical protein